MGGKVNSLGGKRNKDVWESNKDGWEQILGYGGKRSQIPTALAFLYKRNPTPPQAIAYGNNTLGAVNSSTNVVSNQ